MTKTETVKLTAMKPMPGNRNSGMDASAIAELAASIKIRGILQPLLLRPAAGSSHYEIVCGVRRASAAVRVGLTEVPAVIQVLTDQEALAARAAENLNRVNLHPLEEAECYRVLAAKLGSVDAVAKSIGKSLSHVRGRAQLLRLSPKCRGAFAAGKIGLTAALHLSRLEDQGNQDKLLLEALREGTTEDRASRHVAERTLAAMPDLTSALFDIADKNLHGPEGKPLACAACPLATRNQADLFADLPEKDRRCTKPGCYARKCIEAAGRELNRLKSAGKAVLGLDEAKGIFAGEDRYYDPDPAEPRRPRPVREDRGFADLDAEVGDVTKEYSGGAKRTLQAALESTLGWKKMTPEARAKLVVHAVDPQQRIRRLVRKNAIVPFLVKAGMMQRGQDRYGAADKAAATRDSANRKKFRAGYWAAAEAMAIAAVKAGPHRTLLTFAGLEVGGDPRAAEWQPAKKTPLLKTPVRDGLYVRAKSPATQTVRDLAALLLVDRLMTGPGQYATSYDRDVVRVAKAFRINLGKIQAVSVKTLERIRIEEKAKAAAAKKAGAGKAGKKTTKRARQ